MKRIAFFVEGYSEVVFVEKLVREIAGKNNVVIETGFIKGGKTIPKQLTILSGSNCANGCEYYVLILNCQGDHQVATRMVEEHFGLAQQGFEKIIGVRDVRPDFTHVDIPRLQKTIGAILNKLPMPTEMVLSVMEIESIFLGETNHFNKISPAITIEAIKTSLGFDPEIDDMQHRTEPATDLENCYALGGKKYAKSLVQDTVDSLDFDRIYLELPKKFSSIARLVSNIDEFLTPGHLE